MNPVPHILLRFDQSVNMVQYSLPVAYTSVHVGGTGSGGRHKQTYLMV